MSKVIKGIILGAIIGVCALGFYNLKSNSEFLTASLISCLSLIAIIGVSFFLSQRVTDSRRQREILLKVTEGLLEIVTNPELYKISSDEQVAELNSKKRIMSNRITILQTYQKKLKIEKEVSFIKAKFEEYELLIGNHIDNTDYLKQSEKELRRPLELIEQKLFDLMLKLFD